MTDEPLDRRAKDGMYAERASTYAMLYPRLREVARQHGYALTLHGTLHKDLDVVAVPWVDDPSPPDDVAEALRERLGGDFAYPGGATANGAAGARTRQPGGRLAYTILLLGGAGYVDLNVMEVAHGG